MKTNLFKVLLYDFLIIIILNTVLYFLLALIFHDSMISLRRTDEFLIMSIVEILALIFFAIMYMVTFFLPLFYIQKLHIQNHTPAELFRRFMPLVTLIATIPSLFILAIGNQSHGINGEAWLNLWLVYSISYTGLISFVYLVKSPKQ